MSALYFAIVNDLPRMPSWDQARPAVRPCIEAALPDQSAADRFEQLAKALFVLWRLSRKMTAELAFTKLDELTEAMRLEWKESHHGNILVRNIKRHVESNIALNGVLIPIVQQDFTMPGDEVPMLLDKYRWPHDARRMHMLNILCKTLAAMSEFRAAAAAAEAIGSITEASRRLRDAHGELIQAVERVLDEHVLAVDHTRAIGETIFRGVAQAATACSERVTGRLQQRRTPEADATATVAAVVTETAAAHKAPQPRVRPPSIPSQPPPPPRAALSSEESSPSAITASIDGVQNRFPSEEWTHEQRLARYELHEQAEQAAAKQAAADRKRHAEDARQRRAEAPERPYTPSGPSHSARHSGKQPVVHNSAPTADEKAKRVVEKQASLELQRTHEAQLREKEERRLAQELERLKMRARGDAIGQGTESSDERLPQ